MPLEIAAVVVPGHGAASYKIAKQAPHLERYFPEITTCRHATINLHLGIPLQVRNPDIVTPPINWNDNPSGQGERFAITKIELSLPDDPIRYEAWIYIAEYSPHRFNDGVICQTTQRDSGGPQLQNLCATLQRLGRDLILKVCVCPN